MRLKSFFLGLSVLVAIGLASVPVRAENLTVSALAPHEFTKTCSYFRHRANALRVRTPGSPVVQLGESCGAALERLKVADVYFRVDRRVADQQFLTHLTRLKSTIIKMNVARFADGASHNGAQTVQSMTETGEYLIARRLGIFEAHAAWQTAVEEERMATADQAIEVPER